MSLDGCCHREGFRHEGKDQDEPRWQCSCRQPGQAGRVYGILSKTYEQRRSKVPASKL